MGMILFLPFVFDEKEISPSNTQKDTSYTSYTPNTIINRIYKSQYLIIYEIEHVNITEPEPVTIVSSQKNPSDIKKLYEELRYEPISELSTKQLPSNSHVNIFGVVMSMNFKEEDPKCTTLQLFDFDLKSPITVKLWRALSTWITSLSIGARLQIRNLVLKDLTFNSCSITEIYLLAHGNSMIKGALSARANNLNEKEEEILLFLNHQSLLIPLETVNNSNLKLFAPLYLEHKNNKWTIQGTANDQNCSVTFTHFDAKIWQILNEIFIDDFNQFDFSFEKLCYSNNGKYEFMSKSILSVQTSSGNNGHKFYYKQLDWKDLISSKIIIFGVFELEAILDHVLHSNSEESLGNLSILPYEKSSTSPQAILRNPKDHNQFVYTENSVTTSGSMFRIKVKTILNDGNFNEIIRKMIFIIRG